MTFYYYVCFCHYNIKPINYLIYCWSIIRLIIPTFGIYFDIIFRSIRNNSFSKAL
ncbi:hypothetical protein C1646_713536 [Rhizophagus diaphanus]|nr:hypothetical protein C1646_713536 [Rhizophagus diaphanus] [Rhizophagus sp. MUCL 43196]